MAFAHKPPNFFYVRYSYLSRSRVTTGLPPFLHQLVCPIFGLVSYKLCRTIRLLNLSFWAIMIFNFLTKPSSRRLEKFKIVTAVGLLLVIWKIGYDSISWRHGPLLFQTSKLGAGNATLGVETIILSCKVRG